MTDRDGHHRPVRRCGATFSASREGNAIAELMLRRRGVKVTKLPALTRIDGDRLLRFDLREIAAHLGRDDFTAYDLQVEMSSSCGRLVAFDDEVVLFADPDDAAEHLGLPAALRAETA